MLRIICLILFVISGLGASAQYAIPPYTIVIDSITHTTVFHAGDGEKIRISTSNYADTLHRISPDIRIKNGIVDHKTLIGDMLVREYYADSALIGYIEYEGATFKREIYYDQGVAFLEKRYEKGALIYTNTKVQAASGKQPNN